MKNLAERIEALERQNTMLRRLVFLAFAACAAVLVIAAAPTEVPQLDVGRLRVRSLEVLNPANVAFVKLTPSGISFAGRANLGVSPDGRPSLRLGQGDNSSEFGPGAIILRGSEMHTDLLPAGISMRRGDTVVAQLDQQSSGGRFRLMNTAGALTTAAGGGIEFHSGDSSVNLGTTESGAIALFKHGEAEVHVAAKGSIAGIAFYKGETRLAGLAGDVEKSRALLEVVRDGATKRFPE